jgi:hypothetical protein
MKPYFFSSEVYLEEGDGGREGVGAERARGGCGTQGVH